MKAKATTTFFLKYGSLESRKHMKVTDEKQILARIVAPECAFDSGFYTLSKSLQVIP